MTTVTAVTPNSLERGTSTPVTITGTGFTAASLSVAVGGDAGVTVSSPAYVSATSVMAILTVAADAPLGSARTVFVWSSTGYGAGDALFAVAAYAGTVPPGYVLLHRADDVDLAVHFIKDDAFGSVGRPRRVGVFEVIDRSNPVATYSLPTSKRGTFGIATENEAQADAVRALFDTGVPLQFLEHPLPEYVGAWFIPTDFAEVRTQGYLFSAYRVFSVGFTIIDMPL